MKRRSLGELSISRAVELVMEFDPLTFFPETAEPDWAPHRDWLMPDAMNADNGMLLLPCQSYVVRTSHHVILIDSCIGNHKQRPHRPAWHEKSDHTYIEALATHGIAPEQIDYVLCTHMHGDHVGWNTQLRNGEWMPTFPNARYIFSKKELDVWQATDQKKFSVQPIKDSVLPVIAAGQAELVSNDFALDDEVWLESAPGHTPDHLAIHLASGGARAIMIGDMMHSPIQCLHPQWTAWPDWDAELAKATRCRMMESLSDSDTLVLTAHFPLPSAGWYRRHGETFRFEYDTQHW